MLTGFKPFTPWADFKNCARELVAKVTGIVFLSSPGAELLEQKSGREIFVEVWWLWC